MLPCPRSRLWAHVLLLGQVSEACFQQAQRRLAGSLSPAALGCCSRLPGTWLPKTMMKVMGIPACLPEPREGSPAQGSPPAPRPERMHRQEKALLFI